MYTKRGASFSKGSIHDILRNEKYKGELVHNRFKKRIDGKKMRHQLGGNDETIRIPNSLLAIVSEQLWLTVNEAMDSRMQFGRTKAKVNYMMSGKLFCGLCGGCMIGHRSKEQLSYRCGTHVRKATECAMSSISCRKVDEVIVNVLREELLITRQFKRLYRNSRRS